jgi:hypothetical protein
MKEIEDEFFENNEEISNLELIEEISSEDMQHEAKSRKKSGLASFLKGFVTDYLRNKDGMEVGDWLVGRLQEEFPDKNILMIKDIAAGILNGVRTGQEKYNEMQENRKKGISPVSTLAKEIAGSYRGETAKDVKSKLRQTRDELTEKNKKEMYLIADEDEIEEIDLNGEAEDFEDSDDIGSEGFDDGAGMGEFASEDFEEDADTGDDDSDQWDDFNFGGQDADGFEWQTGNIGETFEKDLDVKQLSGQIARQSLMFGSMEMARRMKSSMLDKLANNEDIDLKETLMDGIKIGANVGISTAVAGGIRTAIDNGLIRGTAAKILGNNGVVGTLAFSAVSLASTVAGVGTGSMSLKEGVKEVSNITASTYASFKAVTTEVLTRQAITAVTEYLAPMAAATAQVVGMIAGPEVAKKIHEGMQNIKEAITAPVREIVKQGITVVETVASGILATVKNVGSAIMNKAKNFITNLGF